MGHRDRLHDRRGGSMIRRIPEWICLCGARNRLRDHTCRNCGGPKP